MAFIIAILATILMLAWLSLLWQVTEEDWAAAAYAKVYDNLAAIDRLRVKYLQSQERLLHYKGLAHTLIGLVSMRSPEKEIRKLDRGITRLQKGNAKALSALVMPGYVLLRRYEGIGKGDLHKTIMTNSGELFGKKHAENKTKQLLARMMSYPMIGIASAFSISAIFLAAGNWATGFAILGVGSCISLVIVYAMYDELKDRVKKRRIAIAKQFPGVVSKLALLVTSGMIMDRAWKETSHSHESELYMEMRKTSEEIENLVSPEAAFGNFIARCSTKETAKLASAILQNLSKGNAEIGRLLKDMAREAWQERRHAAKRDAEKANSMLMIPTMMLFLAILVMLMVPIAMNFSGL
jgi:tight adherence protein C